MGEDACESVLQDWKPGQKSSLQITSHNCRKEMVVNSCLQIKSPTISLDTRYSSIGPSVVADVCAADLVFHNDMYNALSNPVYRLSLLVESFCRHNDEQ